MTGMRLTVLGSSGTHAARGRACSSYLVEAGGTRALLDCGNGSLANLTQVIDVAELDAVVLSHLHVDHCADIFGLYYALRFHPEGPQTVDVYAPKGAHGHLAHMVHGDPEFGRRCRFREVAAGDVVEVGALTLTLYASAHPVETLASRVEADGQVLAYSGDSGQTPRLHDCARDADLFVCDSSWLAADGPHPPDLHMDGRQAGATAAAANARRLLVTHVFPTVDPESVAAEARTEFGGEVLIADDLEEHRL